MTPPAAKAADPCFYGVSCDGFLVVPCDGRGCLLPTSDPFALPLAFIMGDTKPSRDGLVYSALTHAELAAHLLTQSPLSSFAAFRVRSLDSVRQGQACKLVALRFDWNPVERCVRAKPLIIDMGLCSAQVEALCKKLGALTRCHAFLPVPTPRLSPLALAKLRR